MRERRSWVPPANEDLVQAIAEITEQTDAPSLAEEIFRRVEENRRIHNVRGINLNPAT